MYIQSSKVNADFYISEHHKIWEQYLGKIAFAIRSAKHQVTSVTPNLITFGREVLVNKLDSELLPNTCNANKTVCFPKLFDDVRESLRNFYERNKKPYTLWCRNEKLKLNDLVWKRNYAVSNGTKNFITKFADTFIGPFEIVKIISAWNYEYSINKSRIQKCERS